MTFDVQVETDVHKVTDRKDTSLFRRSNQYQHLISVRNECNTSSSNEGVLANLSRIQNNPAVFLSERRPPSPVCDETRESNGCV